MIKHIVKIFLLLGMVVLLQSCQQVRLLQFKGQIKSIANYIEFSSNKMVFLDPVLEPEDIVFLTKIGASYSQKEDGQHTWHYELKKIDNLNATTHLDSLHPRLVV